MHGTGFRGERVQIEGDQPRRHKSSGPQQNKGHDKQWDDEANRFEEALSDTGEDKAVVTLMIEVRGTKSIPKLAAKISEIPGVVSVQAGDANFASD